MKKLLVALMACGLISAVAYADQQSPNAGSDECGIGWQVTKQKTLIGTLTRATTNSFLPSTFSMTSGTSGCDQHPIAKNDVEAVKYAATNLEPLTIEMAQGSGEYLTSFAKVMGCNDVATFSQMTQKNYKSIVGSNASGYEIFSRVKAQIKQDPTLASSCGNAV